MGLGTDLIDGQGLDPQTGQQFQSFLSGDGSVLQGLLIVGIHILVETAVT